MFVLHGSSRENGNTESIINLLLEGIEAERIYLREKNILPIVDKRHDPEGFPQRHDEYEEIAKKMLEHDTIVFATPLYWYGMSGTMKNFIDRWSESLRDPDLRFAERMKNKKMYVVIVGGDDPKRKALPLIMQFQYIFDFVGASFEDYIIGEGNKPGDIMTDHEALHKARFLNKVLKHKK
ncbi:flavodoxin family protein [Fictibacillus gelatini]|uniref:flavodoxin family protein n=1 Tax=Fictibacillus gelatini TaxID=225985 RepID=UPI00040FCFFA|nr:flavodoxin family protein [Fictibacillus gelatini]